MKSKAQLLIEQVSRGRDLGTAVSAFLSDVFEDEDAGVILPATDIQPGDVMPDVGPEAAAEGDEEEVGPDGAVLPSADEVPVEIQMPPEELATADPGQVPDAPAAAATPEAEKDGGFMEARKRLRFRIAEHLRRLREEDDEDGDEEDEEGEGEENGEENGEEGDEEGEENENPFAESVEEDDESPMSGPTDGTIPLPGDEENAEPEEVPVDSGDATPIVASTEGRVSRNAAIRESRSIGHFRTADKTRQVGVPTSSGQMRESVSRTFAGAFSALFEGDQEDVSFPNSDDEDPEDQGGEFEPEDGEKKVLLDEPEGEEQNEDDLVNKLQNAGDTLDDLSNKTDSEPIRKPESYQRGGVQRQDEIGLPFGKAHRARVAIKQANRAAKYAGRAAALKTTAQVQFPGINPASKKFWRRGVSNLANPLKAANAALKARAGARSQGYSKAAKMYGYSEVEAQPTGERVDERMPVGVRQAKSALKKAGGVYKKGFKGLKRAATEPLRVAGSNLLALQATAAGTRAGLKHLRNWERSYSKAYKQAMRKSESLNEGVFDNQMQIGERIVYNGPNPAIPKGTPGRITDNVPSGLGYHYLVQLEGFPRVVQVNDHEISRANTNPVLGNN